LITKEIPERLATVEEQLSDGITFSKFPVKNILSAGKRKNAHLTYNTKKETRHFPE
jgi:hypothetical protein